MSSAALIPDVGIPVSKLPTHVVVEVEDIPYVVAGAASAATATGFPLGAHWVCTLRMGKHTSMFTKKRLMNVIVVDNSASMGGLSKAAISTIGRGVFQLGDAVDVVPGIVVVFSTTAYVASSNVRRAEDLNHIQLQSQGNTNITAGVFAAVQAIVDAAPHSDTHIVITFLSDGAHNNGAALDDRMLTSLQRRLEGLSVSVIVVGVGSSSDTSLGMKIKTALETVAVPGLDSIYYAPTPSAMGSVLTRLQQALGDNVSSGGAVRLRCPTHVFMDTGTHDAVVYVSGDGEAVVVVGGGDAVMPPMFLLNAGSDARSAPTPVVVVDMDPETVTEAVDTQVVRLSQLAVARGAASIRTELEDAKGLIQACTTAMAATASWSTMRPGQRAAALKAFRRSEVTFREQLNRLEELRCGVANDSARQAAFLTGMQRKFGAKAVRRADVVDTAIGDVLAQVATTIAAFAASPATDQTLASGDTSFMSLNTPAEQLAEWTDATPSTIDDAYSAVVSYSMCGYPVRMMHTAAVQMDPWQTACLDVEPYLVDTGSLMLANQTGHAIIGPMHQTVTDAIVVVQPECEDASRAAVRSVVNQYLCSVTLCRDLYMFQSAMLLSMHAHVFLKAVSKFVDMGASSAYLRLALQLVYSARVLHGGGVNGVLLKHWLQDWGTLTTGAADECKHPLQVIIALATATYDNRNDFAAMSVSPTPLLTLLCEVVSRRCRGVVREGKRATPSNAHVAADLLGAMYGIGADNSPTANEDAMSPEPENVIVRRSCPPSHVLHPEGFPSRACDGAASVHAWVRSIITPYYHAFRLGHVLQKLQVWTSDSPNTAVFALQDTIAAEFAALPEDPLHFMGISDSCADGVLEAMFAQGMLYNDSDLRVGGTLGDVRDAGCMHELLVDVHMVHYATSCGDKSKRWAATIGDVTAGAATAANLDTFLGMVGIHTHGLSKKVFWSMLRVAKATAARGDTSKKDAFLGKSNSTVPRCFHDKKTKKKDASS